MGIHARPGFFGGNVAVPTPVIQCLPPSVTWIGFSMMGFCSCSSTSICSSVMGVGVGVEVGVGVVVVLTYRRSTGSSPTPTSVHTFSNFVHPSATNLWPRDTVQIAESTHIHTYILASSTSPTFVPFNPLHLYSVSLTSPTFVPFNPLHLYSVSSTSPTCYFLQLHTYLS